MFLVLRALYRASLILRALKLYIAVKCITELLYIAVTCITELLTKLEKIQILNKN